MPTQSNITVKKNDGTTDITYTAMQPSSGDGVQAVWKSLTVGSAAAHQPELRVSAKQIAAGKRELTWTFVYPSLSTNSTTGLTSIVWKEQARAVYQLDPQGPTVDVNEATAQFGNLMASAHAKSINQSLYGPT